MFVNYFNQYLLGDENTSRGPHGVQECSYLLIMIEERKLQKFVAIKETD